MDELFPRVELDRLISSSTVAALGDANWKIRKEALESIQSILEANKRLKPSNLSRAPSPHVLLSWWHGIDSKRCVQPT